MKTIHHHAQNVLATSSQTLPDARLTTRADVLVAAAICQKFQARYLHKWTSGIEGIEEIVVAEWARKVTGLSEDEICFGLDNWTDPWPPSADEFVAACKKKARNDFGLDYYPEYYRQLRENKVLENEQTRVAQKKIAIIHLAKMKEALNKGS